MRPVTEVAVPPRRPRCRHSRTTDLTTASTGSRRCRTPLPVRRAPKRERSAFTVDFADASPHGDVEVRYGLDPIANVWVASFLDADTGEVVKTVPGDARDAPARRAALASGSGASTSGPDGMTGLNFTGLCVRHRHRRDRDLADGDRAAARRPAAALAPTSPARAWPVSPHARAARRPARRGAGAARRRRVLAAADRHVERPGAHRRDGLGQRRQGARSRSPSRRSRAPTCARSRPTLAARGGGRHAARRERRDRIRRRGRRGRRIGDDRAEDQRRRRRRRAPRSSTAACG